MENKTAIQKNRTLYFIKFVDNMINEVKLPTQAYNSINIEKAITIGCGM